MRGYAFLPVPNSDDIKAFAKELMDKRRADKKMLLMSQSTKMNSLIIG
jgi:hypothetical protein